jgi:hypothetical protein
LFPLLWFSLEICLSLAWREEKILMRKDEEGGFVFSKNLQVCS